MATSTSARKKFKCEACGGSQYAVIRFNGEDYLQCMTLAKNKNEDENPNPHAKCGHWSTKVKARDYDVG